MKFDYIIGNPPYQEESKKKSNKNGQNPRKNIFHYFQIEADKISEEGSVLIFPGARWIHQSGKGLKSFGKELINDKRLSTLVFYPNSKEVFGTADISDGVSIVSKKQRKNTSGFTYIYSLNGVNECIPLDNPGDELIPLNPQDISIVNKIDAFVHTEGIKYLHDSILPRSLFPIESDFVENNPDLVREYKDGAEFDINTEVKVFTNDRAGSAGRCKWFVASNNLIN